MIIGPPLPPFNRRPGRGRSAEYYDNAEQRPDADDRIFASFMGVWLGFLVCVIGGFAGLAIISLRPMGPTAGMLTFFASALVGYLIGFLLFYRLAMSGIK